MKNIKVTYTTTENALCGDLIYRSYEYSIDFINDTLDKPAIDIGNKGCFSLAIGTLQVEVDIETKKILYPWGYFPIINYIPAKIDMPNFLHGSIYVDVDELDLTNRIAYKIPKSDSWKTFKDMRSNWIYIGNDKNINDNGITYVEFAKNSALGIKDNNIVALSIKPKVIL
jgi:hypothetical protein